MYYNIFIPASGGPARVDMPRARVMSPNEVVSLCSPSMSTSTIGDSDT